MRRHGLKNALVIDMAIAAAIAGLVLIVVPGLAIVGMLALLVLTVGGADFVIELKRAHRQSRLSLQQDR